jgi:hypothetical protein
MKPKLYVWHPLMIKCDNIQCVMCSFQNLLGLVEIHGLFFSFFLSDILISDNKVIKINSHSKQHNTRGVHVPILFGGC